MCAPVFVRATSMAARKFVGNLIRIGNASVHTHTLTREAPSVLGRRSNELDKAILDPAFRPGGGDDCLKQRAIIRDENTSLVDTSRNPGE